MPTRQRKRKGTTRDIAKRALRVAKGNVAELKALDKDAVNGSTQAATWSIARVSTPASGDAGNTRDGNVVRNMSIQLLGSISNHASATNATYRLVMFQDRQGNGVIPTALQVFDENTINTLYNFNAANRKRFKIIYDRQFALNDVGTPNYVFKVFRRISGKQTYLTAADQDAAIGKNSIFVAQISNQSTNVPNTDINTRFVYRDL